MFQDIPPQSGAATKVYLMQMCKPFISLERSVLKKTSGNSAFSISSNPYTCIHTDIATVEAGKIILNEGHREECNDQVIIELMQLPTQL